MHSNWYLTDEKMKDFKKIFIDTAPFIYFIEGNKSFSDKVEDFLSDCLIHEVPMITSVITYMEFCVLPERTKKTKIISNFKEVLSKLSIPLLKVDLSIAEYASKLRAKYSFLKGLDALQLSIAIKNNCDTFLTNDKELSKIKEIKILILENLK